MFCFCSAFPPAQQALLGSPVWQEGGKVREQEGHGFWGLNPSSVFLTPMSLECPTCVRAGDTVTISKKGNVYWSLTPYLFCSNWELSAVVTPIHRWEGGGPEPAVWVSTQRMAGSRKSGACDACPARVAPGR